ncbi:MAG: DUF1656 domain-containing protein [Epsilonproteobacteria bacterium]|jgi:hypothetical protein|nr:DUF1656 domain-containing protein [Campylobacterota bacterium]
MSLKPLSDSWLLTANPYPHELRFGDIYITPWIPALALAFTLSLLSAWLLNRLRLSDWFVAHAYLFLAILLLWLMVVDHLWIKVF